MLVPCVRELYIIVTSSNQINWFHCKNITASPFDLHSIIKAAGLLQEKKDVPSNHQSPTCSSIVIIYFAFYDHNATYSVLLCLPSRQGYNRPAVFQWNPFRLEEVIVTS